MGGGWSGVGQKSVAPPHAESPRSPSFGPDDPQPNEEASDAEFALYNATFDQPRPSTAELSTILSFDDASAGSEHRVDRILRMSKDEKSRSLCLASHAGDIREVELLLRFGAPTKPIKWDAVSTPFQLCVDGKDRWSALHSAARMGHNDIVMLLLYHGAQVDLQNSFLRTPLFYAAEHGRRNVVNTLLDNGADIHTFDWKRTGPLHIAISRGHRATVQLLLERGADIHATTLSSFTPMHLAAKKGREDIIRLCLAAGGDPNSCTVPSKSTPLHEAAKKCHSEIINILIKAGADVECSDTTHRTPMRIAAALRDKRTEQLLVKAGAKAQHLLSAQTAEEQEETRCKVLQLEKIRRQDERASGENSKKALFRSHTMRLMATMKK